MRSRLADYVVRNLKILGVDTYFSLTGRGLLYLTDAIAARQDLVKTFMHHEQACSYAACGFTDVTLHPSVCMISTGCGSTNAISGVLNAWQDNLPVIFISGQNKLSETTKFTGLNIRTYGNQESNIIEIVKSITKYSVMVDDGKSIKEILTKAYIAAMTGRRGPVWIDIPLDIQNQFIDLEDLEPINEISSDELDLDVIRLLNKELIKSTKPLFLIGSGIRDAESNLAFRTLIDKSGIPFVFTPSAVDIIETSHPLSVGTVGMLGGSAAGNLVLQNSDLVIVLGSRLSSVTTGEDIIDFARNARLLVIDIDPEEHFKMMERIDLFINSDLKSFFEKTSERLITEISFSWINYISEIKQEYSLKKLFRNESMIDLHLLSNIVTKLVGDDEHFVVDSGLNEIILPASGFFAERRRCIHPYSQGSMGYALPASIGVHLASKRKVYTMIGDGSIMLNIQELETISHNKFPIVIYLINNKNYSIIRTRQQELFRNRTIGTDNTNGVSTPDFSEIARAFNIDYLSIKNFVDLEKIEAVKNYSGPLIVEVFTDPAQKYLKPGIIRQDSGKILPTKLDELHIII